MQAVVKLMVRHMVVFGSDSAFLSVLSQISLIALAMRCSLGVTFFVRIAGIFQTNLQLHKVV